MFSPLSGKHSQKPPQVADLAQDEPAQASQTAGLAAPSQLVALAQSLNSSPTVTAQKQLAERLNASSRTGPATQRAASKEDDDERQRSQTDRKLTQRWIDSDGAPTAQAADEGRTATESPPNQTGLSDGLKAGIEGLSGVSLDGVRVHRNSDKPADLQAAAYTQGADIHVAPGQEQHIPHEAWHVVQQQQGRVPTTRQVNGVAINDDPGLEAEATTMGAAALAHGPSALSQPPATQAKELPPATAAALYEDKGPAQRQSHSVAQLFASEEEARTWVQDKSGLKLEPGDYTVEDFSDSHGNCHGYTFTGDVNTVNASSDKASFLANYEEALKNKASVVVFMQGDDVAHSGLMAGTDCISKMGTEGPLIKCKPETYFQAAGYTKMYFLPDELDDFAEDLVQESPDAAARTAFNTYLGLFDYCRDFNVDNLEETPEWLQELANLSNDNPEGCAELTQGIEKHRDELKNLDL